MKKVFQFGYYTTILETQEPILITSRKRGRPKKVKIPIDEIIITTKKKSI